MGDLFNLDGFGREKEPEEPKQAFVYSAPDLKAVYQTFRETGQIPYSYYGQGAPTDEDELARVRAAYPGAFTTPPAPTQPTQPQRPRFENPFARLVSALLGGNLSGNGFSFSPRSRE